MHDSMTVISPFLDLRSGRVGSRTSRLPTMLRTYNWIIAYSINLFLYIYIYILYYPIVEMGPCNKQIQYDAILNQGF